MPTDPKSPTSWRHFDNAGEKFVWIRALSDMDFKPPRLQDGTEGRADERQILDRQPPRRAPALFGRQNELADTLQLQKRTSDACNQVSYEQEQCCFTVDLAVVADRDRHFDAFACLHAARVAPQIEEGKTAVGQAVAKRKLRGRRHVEIGARVMHACLRRPTGGALAVEDGRLPDMTRPAHRQSSRRIEPPGQNVGYGVPRFTPEKPRSQNGVRPRE